MAQTRNFRWLKRASALAAAGFALSLVGCVTQYHYDQTVRERFPAPGAMVSLESHVLHLNCTGEGEPVLGHGYETARCACHAAILTPVAASVSRPFCSARI